MTAERQDYRGSAAALALTSDLNDTTSLNFAVTGDISGWPSGASGRNFAAVLDRGTAKEEKVLCATLASGTMVLASRGYDGTSAKTHSSGAAVEHFGISADKADDLDAHVYDVTRDDHTQYPLLDGSRGFTGVDQLTGTPSSVGGTSNQSGSATTFSRSDHIHAIGQGGISDSGMLADDVVTAAAMGAAAVGNTSVLVSGTRLHTEAASVAALPASPIVGDTAFVADTHSFLEYQGPGNGWTLPWNMGWGRVASCSPVLIDQSLSSGVLTDVNSVTCTWAHPGNRRYEVMVKVQATAAVAGTAFTFTVTDNANSVIDTALMHNNGAAGNGDTLSWTFEESPGSAATLVRKLRVTPAAAGTVKNSFASAVITVKDTGPNGLPS